tara:strand:+ start:160 stop:549 length:390 start_codon:yes stop_codon:yes gene_type:complete
MKAYKIKKTLVQEFISFGRNREDAIANFDFSQGDDFNSVEINGERFTNGEVLESKTTAVSLGTDNIITFHEKDKLFANAIWLRAHEDDIRLKGYDNVIRFVSANPIKDETQKEKVLEIADRYTKISERY